MQVCETQCTQSCHMCGGIVVRDSLLKTGGPWFNPVQQTLQNTSYARSREPPSAITYGNSQQRKSRLVLILGT